MLVLVLDSLLTPEGTRLNDSGDCGSLRIRSYNFAARLGLEHEHEHDNEHDSGFARFPPNPGRDEAK